MLRAMGPSLELTHPPIVEAVLDIDCDLPPEQDLLALEVAAHEKLKDDYPTHDRQWLREHRIQAGPGTSSTSLSSPPAVQAIRFRQLGGRQLVQLRTRGYSFNRLAPYTGLDGYLEEIERTWRIYVNLAAPNEVTEIRLRYINRILLPTSGGLVGLDQYLKLGPRVPDPDNLQLASFLNQYKAVESTTGLQVNVTLTLQPEENGKLPIIFDNAVISTSVVAPDDWNGLLERIQELRDLKNRVFENTLTDACLAMFRTP